MDGALISNESATINIFSSPSSKSIESKSWGSTTISFAMGEEGVCGVQYWKAFECLLVGVSKPFNMLYKSSE